MNLSISQRQDRRRQLRPLDEILVQDPAARQIANRYVNGTIPSLVECLFQMAIHCAAVMRASQAREMDLIRRGFAMRNREF